jgi:signal transduction histidine kinase
LINLLSNSYKFTYSGSISISVKPRIIDKETAAEISVSDTGIGISKEDQKKLFRLFGMLKDKNKINTNGCGIGLTVSKKYVEMLRGNFKVDSNPGEGTKMTFTIPTVISLSSKKREEAKEYEQSWNNK